MRHYATFLLGLHCLPNYIYKCEKWCEAAMTRLRVCAGSSDHSLLVDGISTNISDIMCKRVSEISDEK